MNARRLLSSTLSALAAMVLVVVALLAGGTAASADPDGGTLITGAVTNIRLDRSHGPTAEHIGVTLDWAVPDSARAGDYFVFTLPEAMEYRSERSFPLADDEGNVVAQASVQGRTARFTLTSFVDDHSDVSGEAWFKLSLETAVWTEGGHTLTFELDHGNVTLPYTVDPAKVPSTGTGTWDAGKGGWYNAAKTEVMWRVVIPAVDAESVTIVDRLGPNQAFLGDPYGDYTPLYEGKQILPVKTVGIPKAAFSWSDTTDPATHRPVRTITVDHTLTKDMGLTIRQSSTVLDPSFEQATNEASLLVTTPATQVTGRTTWQAAGGSGLGKTHGKIVLTKVAAESGLPLGGATFDVLDAAGHPVGQLTTAEDGTARTAMLPAGTYSLVETEAPAGYELASDPTAVTIAAGEGTPVTVTNTLQPVDPADPTDPVNPTDPIDPVDPVDPSDPPITEPTPSGAGDPAGPSVVSQVLLSTDDAPSHLAFTGSDAARLSAIGGMFVVAGCTLLAIAARRRQRAHS